MSIKRYPQLAHWGAYTAVVEDGRLIHCEPFADDPDPSPLLDSIVPMVYSDKRIRKPAVRRSWLQKREGSDRSCAAGRLRRGGLGAGARFGGAGEPPGARSLRCLRAVYRLLWLVIGRALASCAFAGATVLFQRRRRGRSAGQLQLGRGAVFPAVCDRHFLAVDRARHKLAERGGALRAVCGVWRAGAEKRLSLPAARRSMRSSLGCKSWRRRARRLSTSARCVTTAPGSSTRSGSRSGRIPTWR